MDHDLQGIAVFARRSPGAYENKTKYGILDSSWAFSQPTLQQFAIQNQILQYSDWTNQSSLPIQDNTNRPNPIGQEHGPRVYQDTKRRPDNTKDMQRLLQDTKTTQLTSHRAKAIVRRHVHSFGTTWAYQATTSFISPDASVHAYCYWYSAILHRYA